MWEWYFFHFLYSCEIATPCNGRPVNSLFNKADETLPWLLLFALLTRSQQNREPASGQNEEACSFSLTHKTRRMLTERSRRRRVALPSMLPRSHKIIHSQEWLCHYWARGNPTPQRIMQRPVFCFLLSLRSSAVTGPKSAHMICLIRSTVAAAIIIIITVCVAGGRRAAPDRFDRTSREVNALSLRFHLLDGSCFVWFPVSKRDKRRAVWAGS